MRYKPLIAFILLCCSFTVLGGCWNNKDINKRMLPVIMGITEGQEGNVQVFLRIPSQQNNTTRTLQAEAKSIDKAIDILRTQAEESVDLLHLKLLLISENTARKSIKDAIEFVIRSREISPKALVAIVSGDFSQLMYDKKKVNIGLSAYDFFGKESGWTPNISIIHIWEAYRGMYVQTEDTAIPIIAKGVTTPFMSLGSAIMNRDRMVGKMSIEETLIYNLYQGQYSGGTVELMNNATVMIDSARVHNEASWSGSTPNIKSHMKLIGVIEEEKGNPTNAEVEKALETLMIKRYSNLLSRLQAHKSDILGLGQYYRNKMTENQSENWKTVWFPTLKQEFTVNVIIRDSGDIK